jgi:hypothetical protein
LLNERPFIVVIPDNRLLYEVNKTLCTSHNSPISHLSKGEAESGAKILEKGAKWKSEYKGKGFVPSFVER